MTRTRVAVAGALGRMGRTTCATISNAPDLELVGGLARTHDGEQLAPLVGLGSPAVRVFADPAALLRNAAPDVLVDFTLYPATVAVAREAVVHGVSPVIGTSGWTLADEAGLAALTLARGGGAALVPNFAIGAVLMMSFAEQAARYFESVEIVEMHHDRKRDKPSGTASLTSRRIETAGGRSAVPIHSVRLRGLVAHQEVLFGGEGELLTIRHDSLTRDSFMGGVLLAVRSVRTHRGLAIGLEPLMEIEVTVT